MPARCTTSSFPSDEAVTLSGRIDDLQARIYELPEDIRLRADDVFRLERRRVATDQEIVSDALLWYTQGQKAEDIPRLLALSSARLLTQPLVIDRHLSLVTTQWNWNHHSLEHAQDQLTQPVSEYHYLLLPTLENTQEQAVSPFLRIVLAAFTEERPVREALDEILAQLEDCPAEQRPEIQQLLLQQVQEAIRMGLLIDPGQHPINASLPTHVETFAL